MKQSVLVSSGEGTCVWRTGPYSGCSTTCIGVQTRDVSCICTVSTMEVTATDDNCFRDSELLQPISTRSCGRECPDTPRPTGTHIHTTRNLLSFNSRQFVDGILPLTIAARPLVKEA